jgi:DNA-binding transcriptional MerR regulator
LRPIKRRGNRRYYQHHEVLLIRRIRELLYEQGFTIQGARGRLGQGKGEKVDVIAATSNLATPLLSVVDLALLRSEIKNVVSLLRS